MQIIKIKRYEHTLLFSIIFGGLLCIGTFFAHAQEPEIAAPQNETITTTQEAAEYDPRAERTLSVQIQDRFINLITNIINRMKAANGRMENIIGRLDSRVAKMKLEGFDTSAAEEKILSARNNLTQAKSILETLPSPNTEIRSDTPRESFILIRTQLEFEKNFIRETHANLREAVQLLKVATKNPVEATEAETQAEEASEEIQ